MGETTSSGTSSNLTTELTLSQMCACLQVCVVVHMHDVCVEQTRCILLLLFSNIMKLCASSYKAHISFMYKNNGNKQENVIK